MKATIARRRALSGAVAAVAAAGLLGLASPAKASPCGARDQIIKDLANAFQERRIAVGLIANGEILEIFVSPGGTWTAVVSRPSGLACIVAAGEAWTWVQPAIGLEA